MKVAALIVALVAAASPVVANADLPKILAIRQNANMTMTHHTTTTETSATSRSTSTSTSVSTMTPPGGGGSGGSGGGHGMAGSDAAVVHASTIGASALALAGVIGALAVGL